LDFGARRPDAWKVHPIQGGRSGREPAERLYVTEAGEFELSCFCIDGTVTPRKERPGPEILLCTKGLAEVSSARGRLALQVGAACLIEPDEAYDLVGHGECFRATIGSAGSPG
jgi:mannose-6-phosphate isomerase class I